MHHVVGALLSVDVTTQSITEESIDDTLAEFVGGRGVGTKLATDRVPFDADPLGPDNALYLATGPLQFSRTSFTGRMSATALSPLTDGLLSSNAGGFLSRNFTAVGYSAVEITGASDDLLAVHVRDDGVTFEAVPELAGATVPEVDEYMAREHDLGEDQIACIGPAGENGVRFASIMTTESRAFGRGGLGAVLGAKGVKAITFEGDADPAVEIDFSDSADEIHRDAATSDSPMKESGTTSVTEYANHVEALPSYYFSERSFEGVEGISGDRVAEKKYEKATCSSCAFACKLPTRDEASGLETEGPEFETVMAFGSNAGVDDIVSVMQSNDLCDRFGLDTISCGDVISAYLASEDAFGDDDLIHDLVRKIAYREGVGDLLAEGIARCHEDLGVDDWTVKGMAFAAHDGRKLHGQGLAFAVANRGADHMYGEFYPYEYPLVGNADALAPEGLDGKPPLLVAKENRNAVLDSAVVCKFSRGVITDERLGDLLDTDYDRLQEIGARIVELERAFNNRRGFDRADDTLPYDLPDFESALEEYYAERGWTDDGRVPGVAGDDAGGGGDTASADD